MGFQADLLTGFAQLLAAAGLGVWSPTGGYAAGATGIVIDATPETLSRAIQLSAYPVADHPNYRSDEIGLQTIVRVAGVDPLPSRDLDDLIFQQLQGRSHFDLSTGVRVTSCSRRSGATLGLDSSKRWSRSSNYYLRVLQPSTHRL